jgi:hypothetical protein
LAATIKARWICEQAHQQPARHSIEAIWPRFGLSYRDSRIKLSNSAVETFTRLLAAL